MKLYDLTRIFINFLCIIIVICELSLNIYLIIINNIYISQNYVKQYIEDLSPIIEDIKTYWAQKENQECEIS